MVDLGQEKVETLHLFLFNKKTAGLCILPFYSMFDLPTELLLQLSISS